MIEVPIPLFAGAIVFFLIVLVLTTVLYYKKRHQSLILVKEHERARVMLDTLPVACFIGNVKGIIYDCNTEAIRLFELKNKQEFISHFDKDLSPEFQPNGNSSQELLLKYGKQAAENGTCIFNWMHQLPDGTPIPALVTLETVPYSGENVLMAYIRDMREHEKMTGEIDRQNKLLKTVNQVSTILLEPDISRFEEILQKSMGIIAKIADLDRICIWKNSGSHEKQRTSLAYQWEESGFRSQIKDGKLAPDHFSDDHPEWNEQLTQGKCLNLLVRDLPPAGQAEFLPRNIKSILVVPVFLQDHFWGYVGFDRYEKEKIFDDSEVLILRSASRMMVNAVVRYDMASELISAKEQAEQSNRSKSIFLSHMSHEIRTPMNAILGITEIQLRDEPLSKSTEEAFGKIYESGDLLLNIINDILDLSKIESGKLEITCIKYDIPSLINDTAQLNRLRYNSNPVEFIINVDENTPVYLFGDELRIKQILNNILSNAFKYTDQGRIEFNIFAEAEPGDETITLVFRVSDTGQGMTVSQLEKLFEEYTRFNMNTNRTIVGAGLGMTITKQLIELMNGNITVESEAGKGSVFTVRIPQKRINSAVCGPEVTERLYRFHYNSTAIIKKTRFIREYMPYGRVLVVDDVESNIFVTKGMLLPYGLNIESVASGYEAIEKVKNGNTYNIIFMDHMMPKMDGIEATKILREMGYTNYIVALTANALVGRDQMFLKNGFDGFISKPIDSRELNLMLNDLIRNKQSPEVIEAARRDAERNTETALKVPASDELTAAAAHDIENALEILDGLLPKLNSGEAHDGGAFNNDDDFKIFTTTVHGMKSALANIGETQLSDNALKLETAAVNGETAVMADYTLGFIKALRSLIKKISAAEPDDSIEASREDMEYLRKRLIDIDTYCEKFLLKDAKTALNELKKKTWPRKTNDMINEISMCLIRGEYSKVRSVINNQK